MSIFTKTNDYVDKPKRNVFDLSFQNNLTTKIGQLTPCFCKEVIPGDSFSIDPTFALRFQPLYFPVQTRMKASLHFFYVRNRNLWDDWKDFIGKTKDGLVPPYLAPQNLEQVQTTLATNKLGDYLGVPTTIAGDYGSDGSLGFTDRFNGYAIGSQVSADSASVVGWQPSSVYTLTISEQTYPNRYNGLHPTCGISAVGSAIGNLYDDGTLFDSATPVLNVSVDDDLGSYILVDAADNSSLTAENSRLAVRVYGWYVLPGSDWYDSDGFCVGYKDFDIASIAKVTTYSTPKIAISLLDIADPSLTMSAAVTSDTNDYIASLIQQGKIDAGTFSPNAFTYSILYHNLSNNNYLSAMHANADLADGKSFDSLNLFNISVSYGLTGSAGNGEYSTVGYSSNAYANGTIKLSALPFRAYESIYNCFYRDSRNNPRMVNGVPEYNEYIPTKKGGADNTTYELHFRNWEQDFLTTAVQSPQQGIAPLVGVNAAGVFTFKDSDNNIYTAKATIGDDGHTLTGIDVHSPDMPQGSLRALVDAISYGISINDFRNVNSMQRWLEANVRKGFRYVDQIASHFGVKVSYAELDMPEFIGGTTIDVSVNQVNATAESTNMKLGDYAGQAYAVGQSQHRISHYFDEHGFVIGILCVYPVPNYSQLLPKYFLKDNALDYFFPEFGHIGMQPITYKEVTPLQSYTAGDSLNDVFGYQRAWYDYLASVDEVHGDFRLSLRDYLINRVYKDRPELGSEFLVINPEDVNNIFSYTGDDDKILGQIYFNVKAKRPIPLFGIPRLE